MLRSKTPDEIILRSSLQAVGMLALICVAMAILGCLTEPLHGGTVCGQVVAQPQVFAAPPAYLSYTQTGYASNTLNLVGGDLRAQAAAQWQAENAELMAEVQAFLAQRAAWKAQQQGAGQALPPADVQPQPLPPGVLPPAGTGNPPYAWAGETPAIVQYCGKCHTQSYSPEGPAGGIFLDGSASVRAKANWELREAINGALADQRMPPNGHALSGEQAGQIFLEMYKGLNAGGNPAPEPIK